MYSPGAVVLPEVEPGGAEDALPPAELVTAAVPVEGVAAPVGPLVQGHAARVADQQIPVHRVLGHESPSLRVVEPAGARLSRSPGRAPRDPRGAPATPGRARPPIAWRAPHQHRLDLLAAAT